MALILETERLGLRRFMEEDAPFMLRLLNEPSWIQFIGDRNVHTIAEAEQYLLKGAIESYSSHGFGFYIVLLKDKLNPIGTCGFAKRPYLDRPDFGFAYLPEYTGQGYAYEMATATLAYGRDVLKLEELCAITTPNNVRSISLLEKVGFHLEKSIMENDEELYLFAWKKE